MHCPVWIPSTSSTSSLRRLGRRAIILSAVTLAAAASGCRGRDPGAKAPEQAGPRQPVSGQLPGAQQRAAGGPATSVPPAMAAGATQALVGLGLSEAPGMQPVGGAFAGRFEEGQALEQPLHIEAGRCYTVVAAGVGIQQLDLELVVHVQPLPPRVLAQSNTHGPSATIGGKATGCWQNPSQHSGAGKVVLRASRGAGTAAAQIYVK